MVDNDVKFRTGKYSEYKAELDKQTEGFPVSGTLYYLEDDVSTGYGVRHRIFLDGKEYETIEQVLSVDAEGNVVLKSENKFTVQATSGTDFSGSKLSNIGTPEADTDAATKKYVDDADTADRAYANEKKQEAIAQAKEYTDTKAQETLQSANSYTDTKKTEAVTEANQYTDEQVGSAKTELQELIDSKVESMLHYKGQVATESELPGADQVVGDVYNVEDTGANYAWNGTTWDKLSEDLSGFATKAELSAHTSNTDIHVTVENKTNWDDKYTKAEVDEKLAGKADSDLSAYATKEELNSHTSNTDIHTSAEEKASFNDKYTKAEVDSKLATKAELTAHTGDTNIHTTAEEKAAWNAAVVKQHYTITIEDTTLVITSV